MDIASDLHIFEPPEELQYMKWCVWEWHWDAKKQKWTKPPLNPHTKARLRTNDPDSWLPYEDVEHLENKGYLLGKDDLLYVIDMDGCRDAETGEIAEWAWKVIEALNSYTEVSPSGTGVHIIGYGCKPQDAKSRFSLEGHEIEVYDQNRYITYTGEVVDFYYSIRNGQDWLDENVPVNQPKNITPEDLALEVPELELTDEEIVRKLSSFAYGEKFNGLYEGRWEDYYPSQSEADLALCCYLAFMTKDEEQIDRIFRNSGLYRGKWERDDYRGWTINKALDSNTDLYVPSVSKQMVEDLFSIRLKLKWKKLSLSCAHSFVYGALLSTAHKHSGVSDEGVLLFASTRDIKLLSGLNISGKELSALIHELEDVGLIKILEVGSAGKATEYLLYSPDYLANHLNNHLLDIHIPPTLCLMMWVQNESKLQYQRDLNPTQKAVIELICAPRFSVGELASIMGMRKNNFKSRVLKGLGEYVRVDKKGFVKPRKNIEKVLTKNFDKIRYENVRKEMKKDRDKYQTQMLLKPLQRYLKETEEKESNRSLEGSSWKQ